MKQALNEGAASYTSNRRQLMVMLLLLLLLVLLLLYGNELRTVVQFLGMVIPSHYRILFRH